MRSEIDRAPRDLSGTIIGFVGTNLETNRHRFYWFLNSNLGFFSMKGGLRKTMRSAIDRAPRDLSDTIIEFVGTNSAMNRHNFYSKFRDLGAF